MQTKKLLHGTHGIFNILLSSNKSLNYEIKFKSMNNKPKHLQFSATKDGTEIIKANSLEELSKNLTGRIEKGKNVNIQIHWNWKYENEKTYEYINKMGNYDIQDTKDAKNIKEYKFNIEVYGEE